MLLEIMCNVKAADEIFAWLKSHGAENVKMLEVLHGKSIDYQKISFEDGVGHCSESVTVKCKIDKDKIKKLREEGKSMSAIAKEVGCAKSYVHKVLTGKIYYYEQHKNF